MPINGKEQTHWFSFNFYDKIIPKKNNYQIKRSTLTGRSFIGPTKEQKDNALMIAYESKRATIYEGPPPTAVKTKIKELVGSLRCEIFYSGKGDLDNISTTILDSLQLSGKIQNDRHIDELVIQRRKVKRDEPYKYRTQVIVSTILHIGQTVDKN